MSRDKLLELFLRSCLDDLKQEGKGKLEQALKEIKKKCLSSQ